MRTQKLLKLHTRSVAIIEMIIKADDYARDSQMMISKIKSRKEWFPFKDESLRRNEEWLIKYTNVSNRLQQYYNDIQDRIYQKQLHTNPLNPAL